MRAGRKKEQFMALVEGKQLDQLDALRVVLWDSRAEVNRQALVIALPTLRKRHIEELARLDEVAATAGMETDEFVRGLVAGRQRVPQLEELEKMERSQLRALLKL